MNLSEERNYQKRMELWEALGFTPANTQLAERYMEMSQPEQRDLLWQAERQDFSGISHEGKSKYLTYAEHLRKRERKQESARLLRLLAAIGGSSLGFLTGGWPSPQANEGILETEQALAIWAQSRTNNPLFLYRLADLVDEQKAARGEPELFLKAMDLCWGGTGKEKILLAAAYLHVVPPDVDLYIKAAKKEPTGFFKSLLVRGVQGMGRAMERVAEPGETKGKVKVSPENGRWAECSTEEVAPWLLETLCGRLPELFVGGLSSEQEEQLKQFVQESKLDDPVPQAVSSILKSGSYSKDSLMFLASVAFLAIEHSDRFLAFYRLLMAVDLDTTLDVCLGSLMTTQGTSTWFYKHMKQLEEILPTPPAAYIRWCITRKMADALKRMAASHPEELRRLLAQLSAEQYSFALQQIRSGNPGLYRELSASSAITMREKAVDAVVGIYQTGREEARRYLLGTTELSTVLPFAAAWQGSGNVGYYRWNTELFQNIQRLREQEGAGAQVYKRALVLEGLNRRAGYFHNYYCNPKAMRPSGTNKNLDRNDIDEILRIFTEEGLAASGQMEMLACIYESYWSEKDKTHFINESVYAVARRRNEWEAEILRQAREGSAILRFLNLRVLDLSFEEYKDVLLSCAGDSAKQVRELLQAVYASHRTWEPELKEMLASKKSQEREMAALTLKAWGAENFREELTGALAREKSKKLQELLQGMLGIEKEKGSPQDAAAPETAEAVAAALLKGGKKRKVAWAFPLCEVHKKDGSLADESYLAAIFVAYADMAAPGMSKEAGKLAGELDERELAACVAQLYDRWLEEGAPAKKKWVLTAFSLHGGEGMTSVLYRQIQEWPKNARGAMACEAVKALAINGSSTALLLVDQISRKFKFRQVKTAAGEALLAAAGQLGISREELEDRIVPNLGFGEDLSQTFDYGPRSFRVVLTPSLELEITDESGKRLKSLPAPGKRDDTEKAKAASDAFKLLKKQLKTVTANQKMRLEQALSALRLWTVPRWQELFVKNPVMHQFAMGLIWGRYEEGCLRETFRYMEDGSFNTADEDEYALPADGLIGLVHPIELSEEDLAAWKEQLSDYEVTQPIPQLERAVYRVATEEQKEFELTRFGGILINGLSLSGKLQNQGWYRGCVEDGGIYNTFYREDGALGAQLEFSGAFIGDENEEVKVYGVRFYRAGAVKRGGYVYDEIKNENRVALGEVSPRYFSEIVLQLAHATAGSEERLAYPACKNR